jgi:hypothetical protein
MSKNDVTRSGSTPAPLPATYRWLLTAPLEVRADFATEKVLVIRAGARDSVPTVLSFRDDRLLVNGTDYDFGDDFFSFLGVWDLADSESWVAVPAEPR